ncbi:MAG: glycosyltransferase [Candidatus Brocadiaceae bacterium]|nr:glycosyltransferase [Candidatus Brocadiaceae bacterium]
MLDEKINVIICTRNRKRELYSCIKSLDEQSYRNFDLIIVDQSDKKNISSSAGFKFSGSNSIKVNYVKDSGIGLSRARNIGITKSDSNYIVFVDDDGILDKNCLLEYSKNLNKYDFVAGRVLNFDKTRYNRNHREKNVELNGMFKVFFVSGGNFGFQKKICDKIGMFDTTLGAGNKYGASEETDFFYRAYVNGFKGVYDSKAVYYHPHIRFDEDKTTSYGLGRGAFYRKDVDIRKIIFFFMEILFRLNRLLFTLFLHRSTNFKINYHILKAEICCFVTFRTLTRPLKRTKGMDASPSNHKSLSKFRIGMNVSKSFDVKTGVGRYTLNLCKSILRADSKNEYFLYSSDQTDGVCRSDMKRVHDRKTGIIFRNNLLRILWEQIALPFFSVSDKLDLYHFTDHALSLLLRTHPTIITVHDIAFIRFPHLFNKSRQVYKKYIFEKSIKKADFIVVPSYSTKKDILHYYRIEEKKIRVVYNGIESRFRPIGNVEEYRRKNNLPSKMILNVGTLEPRKNIVALIKAFEKLRERGLNDYSLVIAGGKGWLYKQILEEIKNNEVSQSILYLDVVKDEDLPVLYNCADIFVYPSLYEGFGLPPLEAMACGVPVITSDTSSLPEVVGDAGIMINPTDVNSLCDSIYNLLNDRELRNRMRVRGLERSKLFSWEKAAKDMLGIYNELCSKTSLLK